MKTLSRLPALALLCSLALGASPALAASGSSKSSNGSGPWLHLEVNEGNEESRVNINVPLSLAEMALNMVDSAEIKADIRSNLPNDMSVSDLRAMWGELKGSADAVLVSVETAEETVHIAKEGNNLVVKIKGTDGENVRAKLPSRVVDALLSGSGDELDLKAAIHELKHAGVADLLNIQDGESSVRLYVN